MSSRRRGSRAPIPPPDYVRVTVLLERRQLEWLELICRHRHGAEISRSAVVRQAVAWYLAKEADWLMRQIHADQLRAERAELDRLAHELPAAERAELDTAATVDAAVTAIHSLDAGPFSPPAHEAGPSRLARARAAESPQRSGESAPAGSKPAL